ncbi:MAG TPA: arylesterase [Caulobacteraceae bacterium]|nr:arylesterase [Caulobacteraceae bacterium]
MASASQIPRAAKIARLLLLTGAVAGLLIAGGAHAAARTPTVVMLGDSVTAGYGLSRADSLPVQLQAALSRRGRAVKVVAAGVSGDTTADALARTDFSVPVGTDLCIVELGGNDLLQGIDPKLVRQNLDAILRKLKARRVPALIVGVKAPPAVGAGYARDFDAAIAGAAKDMATPLYPDWFAGVSDAGLRQRDGLHPNAKGARTIAERLAPVVIKALKAGG